MRDMAGQILHLLEHSACPCGSPGDQSCLKDHLEGFRRRLAAHFASEELQWSGRTATRLDRTTSLWIERLVREHRGFERRLDAVLSQLDETKGTNSPPSAGIAAEIRAILKDLLEHELSETRFFQRTVFEEAADLSGNSRGASPTR